jgi:hypothetical protein
VRELSRFFGIVIRMFVEAGGQHHRAHFHAYYQDHAAVFAVDTIDCLGGSLPKAQQRLVEALAARSESRSGIRPAMYPRSRRCSSIKYGPIFSVVAPCDRGASPVSVLRRDFHHGLLGGDPPGRIARGLGPLAIRPRARQDRTSQ